MKCPHCGIKWTRLIQDKSAATVVRGFCRNCGTVCIVDLIVLLKEVDGKNNLK